jgi:hypothetical protein
MPFPLADYQNHLSLQVFEDLFELLKLFLSADKYPLCGHIQTPQILQPFRSILAVNYHS